MNKKIKRIAAMALVIGIISAAAPATHFNLLITNVYASTTNNDSTLDTLNLDDSDGHDIRIYKDNDYKDKVSEDEVQPSRTYYAKTSSKTVSIDISGPDDDFVRVFRGTSDSTRGKEVGEDIQLTDDSVITPIIVKVYQDDLDNETVRNEDDSKYHLLSTYEIRVRHVDEESTSDTDYGDIYLERLSVGGQMLNLSDSITKYTCNVDSNVDNVEIRATPQSDNYDVSIDGEDVDYDDNYKRTVNLDKGENDIKVDIEHNGEERVYTLIINRGSVSQISTDNDATTKTNQWVQINGAWQYNDAAGNPVRNSWVQNYYLKADGIMATGWLNLNESWYYFGNDGAKKTGWQSVSGRWYYLDSEGKMQTGWIKDITGKYYYLNSDGSMAYNTKIGIYKLGTDGAWIGR